MKPFFAKLDYLGPEEASERWSYVQYYSWEIESRFLVIKIGTTGLGNAVIFFLYDIFGGEIFLVKAAVVD